MLPILRALSVLCLARWLLLSGFAVAQTTPLAEHRDPTHSFGAVAEVYSYSQFMYDRVGVGGYYGAVTYRALPFATLGLGYDYSVYNHSALLDIRQEVGKMRLRPVLTAGLGYSFAGTQKAITSSFGIQKAITPERGLVYRIGGGIRAFFWPNSPIAINAGLFYKNEPGYQVTETKSGSLVVDSYQNVGSLCLSIGLSY